MNELDKLTKKYKDLILSYDNVDWYPTSNQVKEFLVYNALVVNSKEGIKESILKNDLSILNVSAFLSGKITQNLCDEGEVDNFLEEIYTELKEDNDD